MAIAFDAATSGASTTASSLTFSHTITGSFPILFVGVVGETGSDNITGVTYNAVAMTFVRKIVGGTGGSARSVYLFVLANPATGANNVVVSAGSSTFISPTAISYTGASATGQPDNSTSHPNSSATSDSISLTPVAAGCWVVSFAKNDVDATIVAGASTTLRRANTSSGSGFVDNNAIAVGATTLTIGPQSGNTAFSLLAASILPAAIASDLLVMF